jgi:hypothetical protein
MSKKFIPVAIAAMALAGCATPAPTVDTSATGDMTFDGLFPVKNSRADAAWARPDVDLTMYSKVMLEGVGVEYRPGGESGRSLNSRSTGGPFEVTEEQKDRFEALMREVFLEELGKSEHFTIVSEPGPDVLLIRGALLDVVSYIPPETVGRSEIYLSRVGEATLVLELRDSITEAILARSVDRRAAEQIGDTLMRTSRVSSATEVRRLARTWARLLRESLDTYGVPAQ